MDKYVVDNGFFTDSQNNLHVSGATDFLNGYNAAYYNQFSTGGGGVANISEVQNFYSVKFSSSGQMLMGGYDSPIATSGSTPSGMLIGIDADDNRYYIKRYQGLVPNLATAGVWLNQYFTPATYTVTLSKISSTNNTLWSTYLPNTGDGLQGFSIKIDENSNVYLMFDTDQAIPNLTNSGVFQENFINYSNIANQPGSNGCLVKLNASGQKVWATYCIAGFTAIDYYNGAIYSINSFDQNMPTILSTAGTFQHNVPAGQLIMKFDTNTGQRIWGTFYGTPNLNSWVGILNNDIAVNSTGVYVSGQSEDTTYPSYFASSGAFKGQLTGGGDLFLSKFSLDGNRMWSTYFGSDGFEYILGSGNLTILGNRIVISGNQYGNASNIATSGAFLTAPPNTGLNQSSMFFAEFDSSGNRMYASYFGGSGSSTYGEHINPELLNDGSLILWGVTGAQTGIEHPKMDNFQR